MGVCVSGFKMGGGQYGGHSVCKHECLVQSPSSHVKAYSPVTPGLEAEAGLSGGSLASMLPEIASFRLNEKPHLKNKVDLDTVEHL